jgi:hypothetical protein
MLRRRDLLARAAFTTLPPLALAPAAWSHHGWSSFDQGRPLYMAGRAVEVHWRNPHAELVLERAADLALPPGLASRPVPPQRSPVDGSRLLGAATLPTRADRRWTIELAPLSRMSDWQVPTIQVGQTVAVVGFTFTGEQGEAIIRAEYLLLGDKTYGLRSSPA